MEPEKQRIAIAEACGWKKVNYYNFNRFLWVNGVDERAEDGLPDYLNDRNAMADAKNSLSEQEKERFVHTLISVVSDRAVKFYGERAKFSLFGNFGAAWIMAFATPDQEAEAFLKVKGKWEDDATPDHDKP